MPAPARMEVLPFGEYATENRGAMFVSCILQYEGFPFAFPDGANERSGWSVMPFSICVSRFRNHWWVSIVGCTCSPCVSYGGCNSTCRNPNVTIRFFLTL